MNSKRLDPQAAFALAVKSYGEGKLDDAMQRLNALISAHPKGAPRWFAVLASIHLKKDNKEAAADAFAREAEINPAMAGECLKHAVSLYNAVTRPDKLADIAVKAIEKNPNDNRTVSLAIYGLTHAGRKEDTARYIHMLDLKDPWQVRIAYFFHLGQGDRLKCYDVLTEGLKASPNETFIASSRFVEARHLLDFDVLREFEALMADTSSERAKALLAAERQLNRLYWSPTDAVNALPSLDNEELAILVSRRQVLPRRTISPAGERLRIGYLSNDFYDHAVMSVLEGVLKRHDREKYDVRLICYTEPELAASRQHWSEELQNMLVPVHDRTSQEIAGIISDLGIDILIDLKGFTKGARLDIVAISDAPIKVGYLGFPSTVAGADLDYAITDHFITPDSSKGVYHEKLCRLPSSMMPNRPLADLAPEPSTRAAWGLPEDRFVFASFNAVFKISLQTMAMWTRILSAVPGSILWIRCDADVARQNLLKELEANGITADRVIFAPPAGRLADHIARLALADLALDPTPYNGHVTTTDMLRAGLPVLAMRGRSSTSRMTEAQLTLLGLPELVASDDDDYVARAISLANDPGTLNALRQRLAANRAGSPLFDTDRYTRHLESAFDMMAERARTGLAPDHIDVAELAAGS